MTTVDEMTRREVVELVTVYLDGALTPGDRDRFEDHLGECPGCPRYVEQLRATIGILGRLQEDDVPTPVQDALLAAFRTWKSG